MNLKDCIGIGIAGNFAGHLEQAGEINDFKYLDQDFNKPQGIFPFYLPNTYKKLHTFPCSSKFQVVPEDENIQVEPEIILHCEIIYDGDDVVKIIPLRFSAFNDCTIRKENASKISDKKNWGLNSKGIAENWIDIDTFDEKGVLSNYSISSFIYRDGELHQYGITAQVIDYMLINEPLLNWVVECMNNQDDNGPLENISMLLIDNKKPTNCLLAIGATAYEKFGEENYIKVGDIIYVIVHESTDNSIRERILMNDLDHEKISYVKQSTISYI